MARSVINKINFQYILLLLTCAIIAGLFFAKALLSISSTITGVVCLIYIFIFKPSTSFSKLTVIGWFSIFIIFFIYLSASKFGNNALNFTGNHCCLISLSLMFFYVLKPDRFFYVNVSIFISACIFLRLLFLLTPVGEYCGMSGFGISHIRLSLICASMITVWYMLVKNGFIRLWPAVIFMIPSLILLYFSISLTGYLLSVILFFLLIFDFTAGLRNRYYLLVLIIVSVFIIYGIIKFCCIAKMFFPDKVNMNNLEQYTANGNLYCHEINSHELENGFYVNLYLSENEMCKAWNTVSAKNCQDTVSGNFSIQSVLKRYLTSKNLRKDSAGVMQLSQTDIKNIENGIENYLMPYRSSFENRIYEFCWEVNHVVNGGNPGGCSAMQRLFFMQTALHIIKDNFFTGVNPDNCKATFREYYQKENSPLLTQFRLPVHNQVLYYMVCFGFFLGLWITLMMFLPALDIYKRNKTISISAMAILFMAFLTDYAVITLVGANITFFFYFFILSLPTENYNIGL